MNTSTFCFYCYNMFQLPIGQLLSAESLGDWCIMCYSYIDLFRCPFFYFTSLSLHSSNGTDCFVMLALKWTAHSLLQAWPPPLGQLFETPVLASNFADNSFWRSSKNVAMAEARITPFAKLPTLFLQIFRRARWAFYKSGEYLSTENRSKNTCKHTFRSRESNLVSSHLFICNSRALLW